MVRAHNCKFANDGRSNLISSNHITLLSQKFHRVKSLFGRLVFPEKTSAFISTLVDYLECSFRALHDSKL